MKLFLLFGIFVLFCFHDSFQMAIIGKNNHNRVPPPFRNEREKLGSHGLKNHGVRAVAETDDQDAEVQLAKRGWMEKLKKNLPDKFRSPRFAYEGEPIGDPQKPQTNVENVLTGKNTEFDLEKELNGNVSETEKVIAKRGWFKKLWDNIKGVVGGLIGKIISTRGLPEDEQAFEDASLDVVLPDDIVEVDLGNDGKLDGDQTDTEKEIQLVKRGFLKKIGKKIKKVTKGAVFGTLVKREYANRGFLTPKKDRVLREEGGAAAKPESESEPTNKLPQGNLPLLLKTLRLRPGTADEITKIVEELGEQKEFQDVMIKEVLDDQEDFEVTTANGKGKRKCRLIGRRIVCRRV